MRLRHRTIRAFVVLAVAASPVSADVRMEEKSQVKFAGMLGGMMNMFGGKAARDGMVSTVIVKGDRKMTLNDQTAQIIDLAEEKVYDLDMRRKTYTVTTFDEMRRQMEDAKKKAEQQAPRREEAEKKDAADPQVDVDFDLKESGQTRTINGYDAREVIMTITVREKGKTLEQDGGMVMTSHMWMASKVPGVEEVAAFDRRYAQKLHGSMMLGAQQMAMALAMYPMLGEAMQKFEAENVNMDGTPVMTTTTVEAVAGPEEAASAESEEPKPSGLGGLGGMLARRMRNRDKEQDTADASTPGRATFMTMQHEVMKVSSSVSDADVAIPAGFKQR